jgi:hypothetical protein
LLWCQKTVHENFSFFYSSKNWSAWQAIDLFWTTPVCMAAVVDQKYLLMRFNSFESTMFDYVINWFPCDETIEILELEQVGWHKSCTNYEGKNTL